MERDQGDLKVRSQVVRISSSLLEELDQLIDGVVLRSRTQAVEVAVTEMLERRGVEKTST